MRLPSTDRSAGTVAQPTFTPAVPRSSADEVPDDTPTAADLDQPLLGGGTELQSQWQRVQSDFVDDPLAAVTGAADLVERAAQALIEALGERQRQLRAGWDRNAAAHTPADAAADTPADTPADTEQLRQLMRRYRALFNQLSRTV
jgi:hypothetical protein